MSLIKEELKEIAFDWAKLKTTLEYIKGKFSSFETIDEVQVNGDQFKFNARRGRNDFFRDLP